LAEEEAEEVVLVLFLLTEGLVVAEVALAFPLPTAPVAAEEEHALRIACWLFLLSEEWCCF